jgi:hypothetical protein
VVAKINGSLVERQSLQSCPEVKLVPLGSAGETTKDPPLQLYGEAARRWTIRGMKWAGAPKLVAAAGSGMIIKQIKYALHRNLAAHGLVIDPHCFWSARFR